MEETILSLGLQVQFINWGFTRVEIVKTCEDALRSVEQLMPSLVMMDEKILGACKKQQENGFIRQLNDKPIILMSNTLQDIASLSQLLQRETDYLRLNKPCTEKDLKLAVEQMLDVSIPAA